MTRNLAALSAVSYSTMPLRRPSRDFPPGPPSESSTHERAVEALARQSHVSIDHVAQLYAHELAALTVGARITGFLTILTTRKVREILRQRQSSSARLCGTCSLRTPHARRRVSPRWFAQDNW